MNRIIAFILPLALLSANAAFAGGDVGAGKTKAAVCGGCHGADGNSTTPMWPKLAGQSEGYIAKQLADFKEGRRKNATMKGMSAGLSDQDMADIGAWFAAQTSTVGSADEARVAIGERVYRGGNTEAGVAACMGCHGPTGSGNPAAGYPGLGGQHAEYTAKQLVDFRSRDRFNDGNGMMRDIAARMTDDEIKGVAEYIAGLH